MITVEACVTSVDDAVASVTAGADRLGVGGHLHRGGRTPGPALLRDVLRAVDVPVFAMARPRAGSFVLSASEIDATRADIERLVAGGADGIVVGALRAASTRAGTSGDTGPHWVVDVHATRGFAASAGSLPVTFHRAFDQLHEPLQGLDTLIDLGVRRVLTSGGPRAASEGVDTLAALVDRAGGRLTVMAGGRVRADHVERLIQATGVREVHARAGAITGIVDALRSR